VKIRVKNIFEFNELVIRKGLTKNGLGKKAGISSPMIVQISNGVRNPSPPIAKKICNVLEVKFDDIFVIEKQN
jgi:DNA-binding XRE family transcriptional regulator